MADLLSDWWVHPASLRRPAGRAATGDVFADPENVVGFYDDSTRLVLNAEGEQVTANGTYFLPAATADVPVGTEVTFGDPFAGRPTARVITAKRHNSGGQGLPDHLELALQ